MSAICVFCSSSSTIDSSYLTLAAEVGQEIAARGHRLISGGGRVSMMGAVATAARAGGAHTAGVIPQRLLDQEVADVAADELVVVDTMRERKAEMDRRADAFLILPGGIGTLEEMFEVWTTRSLGMSGKPVVLLDPAGIFDPLWTFLGGLVESGFVRAAAFSAVTVARDIPTAFAALAANGT